MLHRIEKNSEDIEGNFAYVAIETARNPSVGFREDQTGEGPHLPPAGRGSYANVTFNMGFHYLRGQISGPVMRRSKSTKGSFTKALDVEMRNLIKTGPEDLNRKLWSSGNGRGGTPYVNTTQLTSTLINFDSRDYFSLKIGDRVHFATEAALGGIMPAQGTTVVAITRDTAANTHAVELAAAAGTTLIATTGCYFGGAEAVAAAKSSWGQTMHGIPDAVNDGNMGSELQQVGVAGEYLGNSLNFGGQTRAATLWWQSQRLGSSGTLRPLTITLLSQAWQTARFKGGADPESLEIYTNPGLFTTAGLLVIGDRRLSDSMKLVSGFTSMDFNGSPIMVDVDAPRDIFWFLQMKDLMLLTQGGYEFLDDDGSTLRVVANRDAWEFTLARDIQLGARGCHRHVILDDIESKFHVETDI